MRFPVGHCNEYSLMGDLSPVKWILLRYKRNDRAPRVVLLSDAPKRDFCCPSTTTDLGASSFSLTSLLKALENLPVENILTSLLVGHGQHHSS